jgi:uncharacterized membrane protein
MVATITTYQWLLAIHIFAAVVWVGGGLTINLLATFAVRSPLPGRKAEFAREAAFVGQRIFAPTSLILLLFGIWIVHHVGYSYSKLWLMLGVIGWLASFAIGIGFLGPTAKKIDKTIEAEGPDSAAASALIDRVLMVARIDAVILTLVVFDMVLKPGS